jgi:uncharacterized protein (TIGR02271 family)
MNTNDYDSRTQPMPHVPQEAAPGTTPFDVPPVSPGAPVTQHADQTQQTPRGTERVVVQLRQEELVPVKEWVESGAVLIRRAIEAHTETLPVEVLHEEVDIERIPVERVLAEGEAATPRQEGNALIIPVVQEELVVVKRRVVREELRITKRLVGEQQEVTDTVRHEKIDLDTEGHARVHVLDPTQPDAGYSQAGEVPPAGAPLTPRHDTR